MKTRTSRISGFYKLPLEERRQRLAEALGLDPVSAALLREPLLDDATASHMIENVVGVYGLPLGVGLNFRLNGKDYLIPMCVEEPSVVAAASNAARMVREAGGFHAEADDPIMISQVQLCEVRDTVHAKRRIEAHASEIVQRCHDAYPNLLKRGGGTRGIEVRVLEPESPGKGGMLSVDLHVDVRDAMGANLVNTLAEAVADRLAELAEAQVGLRILSNLADRRCVRVRCRVNPGDLGSERHDGEKVVGGIVSASRFAELDPYRAATHNKGIMNGIDPVVIATGNDWRGVEAGAHAFAATKGAHGGYGPLATWRVGADGALEGQLELPMAVGTVGGTLKVHPGARLALEMIGVKGASELGMVMAAVGLASNLAALRAMASDGIQRGHMSMHARTVALGVGATGEQVEVIAAELARLGDVRAEVAKAILDRLRKADGHSEMQN
jgi:hydroxymethylglutaryl-CoA reductase